MVTMEEEQEVILANFFKENIDSFYHPYGEQVNHDESYMEQFLWEDFKAAKQFADNTKGICVYTVVQCDDDEAWLIDGWHIVNRIGYFFSSKKIDIPEEGLRYW